MTFRAIRARLAMAYGWTPRQIGQEVTLPQLRDLLRSWAETPPLAAMAAAVLRAFRVLEPADEVDWNSGAETANPLGGAGPVYSREQVIAQFAELGIGMG